MNKSDNPKNHGLSRALATCNSQENGKRRIDIMPSRTLHRRWPAAVGE